MLMTACVLYFSQTGNTRQFADAIADAFQIPTYNLMSTDPSIVRTYDVVVLGTPVHGFRPAVETLDFIARLPEGQGKWVVLFCSYAMWTGRTFTVLENELKKKGYQPILRVKKKMKKASSYTQTDFADAIEKMTHTVK
jgi:flavodoxin